MSTLTFTPTATDLRVGDEVLSLGHANFDVPHTVVLVIDHGTGLNVLVVAKNNSTPRRIDVAYSADITLLPPF